METHPVPQNISSYEFRLVGDMTLKQFLQLAGGVVLAFIFIRLPLINLIKFPLAFISGMTGIAMAFIPINSRPFSTWFFAFLKAIYSPTEYVWKPVSPPSVIAPAAASPAPNAASGETVQKAANPQFVPSFSSLITSKLPKISPTTPTQTTQAAVAAPPPPAAPSVVPPAPASPPETLAKEDSSPRPATPLAPPQPVTTPPVPQAGSIQAAPQAQATSLIPSPTNPNVLSGMVNNSSGQPLGGITVEIVDTATGIPARALRTNRLGQFQIAIPLTPGTYNVIAEMENMSFEPVSIQVKGTIIPPIILTAKPQLTNQPVNQ